MLMGLLACLYGVGSGAMAALAHVCTMLWGGADRGFSGSADAAAFARDLGGQWLIAVGPVLAVLSVAALIGLMAQGRFVAAPARLKLKWDKLSPAKGLTRLFGKQALVEFAKTLLKLAIVLLAGLWAMLPAMNGIDQLIGADPVALGQFAVALATRLAMAVTALAILLAGLDIFWQHRSFRNRMRMSLKELKDEHKDQEGDPIIKSRIRAIAQARARRRMMAAVPGAAVVITNPTHYAVALKYEHGHSAAPVVVAKGVDAVALKIREKAVEAGVPVVESPPLARALHASVDIDQPIQPEHYAAVAEIIGYVLRLAREKKAQPTRHRSER